MNLVELDVPEAIDLAPATEHDRYFDYCLEPYRPRRPWRGKLRSENLLWHSIHVGGATSSLEPPLRAVQDHVGRDLTVWGVKWNGEALFWELYFYDPQKEAPEASIGSLTEVLAPWLRVAPRVPETIPYMMVSLDLSPATTAAGVVEDFNLYMTGEKAHAGRSYEVRKDRIQLENTYRFMEPKRDVDEVLPLVESSVFVDYSDPRTLSKVLFPELFACKKVCVSKKRTCDAIYFSGIAVDQLRWFLARFDYPAPIQRFVAKHELALEHLYFDVGIDYRQRSDRSMEYPKTSYYGTL